MWHVVRVDHLVAILLGETGNSRAVCVRDENDLSDDARSIRSSNLCCPSESENCASRHVNRFIMNELEHTFDLIVCDKEPLRTSGRKALFSLPCSLLKLVYAKNIDLGLFTF